MYLHPTIHLGGTMLITVFLLLIVGIVIIIDIINLFGGHGD